MQTSLNGVRILVHSIAIILSLEQIVESDVVSAKIATRTKEQMIELPVSVLIFK